MRLDSITNQVDQELHAVGVTVGTNRFEQAALALVAATVPNEMQWVIAYDAEKRPRVLHFDLTCEAASFYMDRDEFPKLYESGYYRFDPIYRYWREVSEPGVFTMHHMPDQCCDPQTFLSEFMPITQMEDQAVVLIRTGETQALGFCISRSIKYSLAEAISLQFIYPLLSGLFETHMRLKATTDPLFAGQQPEAEASDSPLDFSAAVAEFLPDVLTRRERQIVKYILAGYPNAAIANRLGIGEGTARNHKKRLYGKLDITAERELFSMFIGFLAQRDASELLTAV